MIMFFLIYLKFTLYVQIWLPSYTIDLLAIAVHANLFRSYSILGSVSQMLDLDPKVVL